MARRVGRFKINSGMAVFLFGCGDGPEMQRRGAALSWLSDDAAHCFSNARQVVAGAVWRPFAFHLAG